MIVGFTVATAAAATATTDDDASSTPQLISSDYVLVKDSTLSPRAHTNLSFTNLEEGYAKKSTSTYYIISGDDYLEISSLTWTPTGQNVSVAFINAQTGATYAVEYSGGSVTNETINTTTVPTGEYYVAVVNYDGSDSVTGTLSYDFS